VTENGDQGAPQLESFTCLVCGRTSYHPTDVEEGWCGACHGATAHPTPPGLRWALLRGGSVDAGRLLAEPLPDRYEVVLTGEVYVRADNGNGYSIAAYELEVGVTGDGLEFDAADPGDGRDLRGGRLP
jgi:hypothetical protein